jgi:hypothetical protein
MAAAGIDPWAAASAASAATAAEERAAAQAARRQAAKKAREAAAEAARRVAEAAALADAAKADASTPTGESNPGPARTPRRFDVWAAATAEAGVADVAGATTVDHDVPGVSAAGERDGAAGDAAPEDGAV